MPYIKQEDRKRLAGEKHMNGYQIQTPGELNFLVSELAQKFLQQHGRSYTTINTIVGALESAKLEFYRRVAVPYEDNKIEENGDVY